MSYQPPITITPAIVNLCSRISERVGRLSMLEEHGQALRLRRLNRIRTIHGSLAIEGNTLSEAQITAILEGKRILAPPREVQEAHNALAAYDLLHEWVAHRETDLLHAHRCLMSGLLAEAGSYRRGGVGVMSGDKVIHMAPQANRVPVLMRRLLNWLKSDDAHPLINSSVFHYEFEFIHPFADGNGRMGRLWQTLILSQWQPLFAYTPVESMVHQHQSDYYRAIRESTNISDAHPFVHFMLSMILEALEIASTPQDAPQETPQDNPQAASQVLKLIGVLRNDELSRDELMEALLLSDRKSFLERYLNPAMKQGLVERTIPDKPRSPLQRYRLTAAGQKVLR